MDIEILVVPDCPNGQLVADRLHRALEQAGLPDVQVATTVIADQVEAEKAGFTGSPTVVINGHDPFAEAGRRPALACRIYRTPSGPAGAPTTAQLVTAIAAAHGTASA